MTGLNASARISYNKFLAKLASDHRKPNGQYVITPEMGPAFVEALPVGKFHGIGPATSAKLNSLGLRTGLDVRNQTLDFMQGNFGKAGVYYYWISRGVDDREVRANRIRKMMASSVAAAPRQKSLLSSGAPAAPRDLMLNQLNDVCGNVGRDQQCDLSDNRFEHRLDSRRLNRR